MTLQIFNAHGHSANWYIEKSVVKFVLENSETVYYDIKFEFHTFTHISRANETDLLWDLIAIEQFLQI